MCIFIYIYYVYPSENVHQVVEGVRLRMRVEPRAVVPLARVLV